MVKTLIKLYSAAVASADNVASAIVPQGGQIVAVSWAWQGTTSGTVGGRTLFQLSLQSTGQFVVNDARNIIDELACTSDCVTTAVNCGGNKFTPIGGVKINAGDKVYLHLNVGAAMGVNPVNCVIQIA